MCIGWWLVDFWVVSNCLMKCVSFFLNLGVRLDILRMSLVSLFLG